MSSLESYKKVMTKEIITIAPVKTVVHGPVDCALERLERFTLLVVNLDLTQTLDVLVERADSTDGPWEVADTPRWQGIGPGLVRVDYFPVGSAAVWLRITGTSSGAGLSARVTVGYFFRVI